MTKRRIVRIALVCLILVSLFGIWWNFFGVHEIAMPEAELQQKIDAKLPHTTKNGITVSSARLDLSDNKTGIVVAASMTNTSGPVAMLKGDFRVTAQTRGELRYDPGQGAFYFHPEDVSVHKVQHNNTTIFEKNVAGKIGNIIGNLTGANVNAWAQSLNSTMKAAAESVLDHTPVYTLPDNLKGNVVRAVLTKVEVRDGAVIAHISIWQFTGAVIGYAVLFVVALVLSVLLMIPGGLWR